MNETTRQNETRQLPAVSGSVKLLQSIGSVGPAENRTGEIEITSQTKRGPVVRRYFLQVHDHGFRLVGWDDKRKEATVYDIPASLDSCDCRDFTSRADRREDGLCKHCRALRSLASKGKLPVLECRPVVDYIGDEEAAALADACGWEDAA
jgi:hypothetical protein